MNLENNVELTTLLFNADEEIQPQIGYCCPLCSKTIPIYHTSQSKSLACNECMTTLKELIAERRNKNK